jgi:RimJ/RimL family protein N-acetyltransferase
MPLYGEACLQDDSVRIGAPDLPAIGHATKTPDVADSVQNWLAAARGRANVLYFSIYEDDAVVGQIILHDIDKHANTSLIGYHLFEPRFRGRGIGTVALRLLVEFVRVRTNLERLFIITSDDNVASQHVARKCGFTHVGPSREDPIHGMVFELAVSRPGTPSP